MSGRTDAWADVWTYIWTDIKPINIVANVICNGWMCCLALAFANTRPSRPLAHYFIVCYGLKKLLLFSFSGDG